MKLPLACCMIVLVSMLYAQKYDSNWVFGENAGINFNRTDSVYPFKTNTDNYEMTGCISDPSGSLLFYLTDDGSDQFISHLVNKYGTIIAKGDSIKAYGSNACGTIILPSYEGDRFMLLHLGKDGSTITCGYVFCPKLFMTMVKKEGDSLIVEKKNHLLLDEYLFEKVAAVKHANGKDWWVIAHTEYDSAGILLNRFYRFLISDTIVTGPYIQHIGTPSGEKWDYGGQMKISRVGNFLALLRARSKHCEVYQFNRDNGLLSSFGNKTIQTSFDLYSLEFSPREQFLYITAGVLGVSSELYQTSLSDSTLPINLIETNQDIFTQVQLAPDHKMYIGNVCDNIREPQCNQYLSVIHQPDSAWPACDFRLYDFYLGDSSESNFGLPNLPDYNLAALSVYQADAGTDMIICSEDTTVKGVFLGTPPVSGVSYSWYPPSGLNETDVAQPFADPTTSTWYYVTITDSTSPNLCKSRIDSVFVEVTDCSVGIKVHDQSPLLVKIYPNPVEEILHIQVNPPHFAVQTISITDINSRNIIRTEQTTVPVSSVAPGLYFVRVEFKNGVSLVKKVVVK